MTIKTLTSRQFSQNTSKARKEANSGPVFITVRGRPAHVLLTYDEYKKITRKPTKIADLLAMSGIDDVDFGIPRLHDVARQADLS